MSFVNFNRFQSGNYNFFYNCIEHSSAFEMVKTVNLAGLEFLIDQGIELNAQDASGETLLHLAMQNFHSYGQDESYHTEKQMVYTLIQSGSDVSIKDNDGSTPLHYLQWKHIADSYNRPLFKETILEVTERLIENGADVNAQDNNGFTPLLSHIVGSPNQRVDADFIHLLLENGSDPNKKSNEGHLALHEIMSNQFHNNITDNSLIIKDLVDHGANPNELASLFVWCSNVQDYVKAFDGTALDFAIASNSTSKEGILYLIENGAKCNHFSDGDKEVVNFFNDLNIHANIENIFDNDAFKTHEVNSNGKVLKIDDILSAETSTNSAFKNASIDYHDVLQESSPIATNQNETVTSNVNLFVSIDPIIPASDQSLAFA